MDNPTSIWEIINTGGVVALLVINLWSLATGKVMPKATVDKIIQSNMESTTKLANEIKDGIENAVQNGIVAGIFEVRNGKDKKS